MQDELQVRRTEVIHLKSTAAAVKKPYSDTKVRWLKFAQQQNSVLNDYCIVNSLKESSEDGIALFRAR